jgi:hypothetical protein
MSTITAGKNITKVENDRMIKDPVHYLRNIYNCSTIYSYKHQEQMLMPLLAPITEELGNGGRNVVVMEDTVPMYCSNIFSPFIKNCGC